MKYYGRNKAAEPLPEKSDWDVLMKEFQSITISLLLFAHCRFIRNDSTEELRGDWEKRFAKSYYDKLVRNYCIGDFSRYKEKKVAIHYNRLWCDSEDWSKMENGGRSVRREGSVYLWGCGL